jgi:hypothetical protein
MNFFFFSFHLSVQDYCVLLGCCFPFLLTQIMHVVGSSKGIRIIRATVAELSVFFCWLMAAICFGKWCWVLCHFSTIIFIFLLVVWTRGQVEDLVRRERERKFGRECEWAGSRTLSPSSSWLRKKENKERIVLVASRSRSRTLSISFRSFFFGFFFFFFCFPPPGSL